MKRNILLAIAVVFTLSIGAAVYAFNSTTTTNAAAVSCCCKGDSCPLKSKDAKASADLKESCCGDKCDCCSGDSCPMKKGDASTTAAAAGTATAADAKHSCPMMKDGKMSADHHKDMKGMDHKDMKHADMKHDGEHSCGCGCACCAKHKETKTETAVL